MAKRRSNGEGCVYKESRSGRWVGKFVIGYNANGERKYKTCRGKTEKEVIAKLSFIHWLRNKHCLIILTLRYLGAKKILNFLQSLHTSSK